MEQTQQLVRSPLRAPGPRGRLLLGSAREFFADPLKLFMTTARTYGDVARIRLGPIDVFLLSSADHVKRVLVDRAADYGRNQRFVDVTHEILGAGLFNSSGESWKQHRRTVQPLFHKQRINAFASMMADETEKLVAGWASAADRAQPIAITYEMTRLTQRIVGRTFFSLDVGEVADEVGELVMAASRFNFRRLRSAFSWPLALPTPSNRRFLRTAAKLDEIVGGLIQRHRELTGQATDLLSMLMEARDDETGERLTDQQLLDHAKTFYLAGYETTANAFAWALYALAKNPPVERQLRRELAAVLGGRRPTVDDLPNLPYLTQVIEETLRLYSPAWAMNRTALVDDEIDGYRIPRGSEVVIAQHVLHRDPRYWTHPEGFDPDHFSPEQVAARHRFAYFPFGGGQRKCIGTAFATLELQIGLAVILQAYQPRLVPGTKDDVEPAFTLHPGNALPMTVHRPPPERTS
ncbi:MAG: cytochrome P450 [Kofleriaceae bacterium]